MDTSSDMQCRYCNALKPRIAMVRSSDGYYVHTCLVCAQKLPGNRRAEGKRKMLAKKRRLPEECLIPDCHSPRNITGYCPYHARPKEEVGVRLAQRCPSCHRWTNASGYCPVHDPRRETA